MELRVANTTDSSKLSGAILALLKIGAQVTLLSVGIIAEHNAKVAIDIVTEEHSKVGSSICVHRTLIKDYEMDNGNKGNMIRYTLEVA